MTSTNTNNPFPQMMFSKEDRDFNFELDKLELLYSLNQGVGRKYFLSLAKKYHPDKGGDHIKFKEINEIKKRLGQRPKSIPK